MTLTSNITFNETVSYLEYKTNGPYFAFFKPGAYLFELWGAQGGCLENCTSAKGGYSRGVLYLRHTTKIFVNIGQQGSCVSIPKTSTEISYNGGGYGRTASDTKFKSCAGGGGATDIRIKENTIFHRILVSGDGGGDSFYLAYQYGGYGGGLVGGDGSERCHESGYGGNQESGGKGYQVGSEGSFGQGGNVGTWDGGGGGGWYGGSSGQGCQSPGGGGSGFALTSSTYKIAKKISEYAISKEYVLTNTKVLSGNEQQHGFKTIDLMKGNIGNGKAKITILHSISFYTCKYKKMNNINICLFLIIIQK